MNPGDGRWIGVLGGGQLGRMFAFEARRMGFRVLKWTGGDVSGAAFTADRVLQDPFDSPGALELFLETVEAATVEFENVPADLLETIESRCPLIPGAEAVATCQHREREKRFLRDHRIPCASFHLIESAEELERALSALDQDAILKTAEFGYDGKGQVPLARDTSPAELNRIWKELGTPRGVLEERVPLAAELSVLVARDRDGGIVTYDPAENLHRNHILDVSIVPARLPDPVLAEAREIAIAVAEAMRYVGLLGVEFFLGTDGRLLVNELAPRPHNSGHHSFDACATSQFEQQLRTVAGLPLGTPRLLQPAVMWNLLGDLWPEPGRSPDWTPVLATPGAKLHIYGKSEARPGRKMGHVTFLASDREEALRHANTCRAHFGFEPIAADTADKSH